MKKHRAEESADELWQYFEKVFKWVQDVFGKNIDKSMKGVPWGLLYNARQNESHDQADMQAKVRKLLKDPEIGRKSGIYEYLLTGQEKHLNLRAFDEETKQTVYHQQDGKCAVCGKACEMVNMHADYITAWRDGGKTVIENCQMLCRDCNLKKGAQRA